jgi:hypothetical protein
MEDLFRLVLLRPAVAQDPSNPSIDLTQSSNYQTELRHAIGLEDAWQQADSISRAFVASAQFLGIPEDNPYADRLEDLYARLDALPDAKPQHVRKAVSEAFGMTPAKVVADAAFTDTLARLRDSVIAIKVLQEEQARPFEELIGQLRLMELVARAAADSGFPDGEATLAAARKRTVQLPGAMKIKSRLSSRKATEEQRKRAAALAREREAEVERLLERHEVLRKALGELGAMEATKFVTMPPERSEGVLPPDELRAEAPTLEMVRFLGHLRGLQLKSVERGLEAERTDEATTPTSAALITPALTAVAAVPGRQSFVPQKVAFTVTPEASRTLTKTTQALLAESEIDLTQTAVDRAAGQLQAELASVVDKLEMLSGHPTQTVLKRVGGALLTIETPLTTGWGAIGTGGTTVWPSVPVDARIPHTKGSVRPAGVADLLVVRQQLTGYERADVAHIENVLKGERKAREHTRRQESVLTTFTETEVSSAEERELESTSRFEMTREASQTIKEDVQLKAGLKVSGKYGPVVEFAVSAEGSYQRTKEEATKSASKFSQDVTERSSRKIAERVLERTTLVVTNEVTEKNTHELNNVAGTGHVSGVYQWVNKVYQAQMFNYGLRAMFDFMVPEPAAFVTAVMNSAHASGLSLTKPPAFTLQPSQVNESNYGYWIRVYRATDVAPPPEIYKTASFDFKAGGGDSKTSYNHSGQIAIDEGYRAVWGTVGVVRNIWDASNSVDVILGQRTRRMGDGDWMWSTSMADERGSVPVAIDTYKCSQVAVAIEVKCQRTDRAMEKWRLETHAKLMTAYQARLAEYEEKLAQLELQAGVAIQGRNPAANQITIADELKKNCVSILTDQHFDAFDAINPAPSTSLPQIDLYEAEGEGPYVRFFEQAFEWEHMTWVTYPYFWGRKSQWDERVSYEDPDPAFADFLRAGYARVTVPARPGFETAVDHFLTFGEIWNGGPLPPVSSPLYLPIADELADRLGRPESEVPQGDPWTVRVPTTLVHLRPDDKLPVWEEDANGNWVEKP